MIYCVFPALLLNFHMERTSVYTSVLRSVARSKLSMFSSTKTNTCETRIRSVSRFCSISHSYNYLVFQRLIYLHTSSNLLPYLLDMNIIFHCNALVHVHICAYSTSHIAFALPTIYEIKLISRKMSNHYIPLKIIANSIICATSELASII